MRTFLVALAFVVLAPLEIAMAEPPASLDGTWSGVLETPGGELHLVLQVHAAATGLVAEAFSPDQGEGAMPADHIRYENGALSYDLTTVKGRYEGRWDEARQAFAGTWIQGGATLPLILQRGAPPPAARPQTPSPPFPYATQDITFANPTAPGVTLAGTLTLPAGAGPFPAAVLISGSGPNDRDETILRHKPFAVIADALTRRGVAVLRFDKRGIGGSKGSYVGATTLDFASDAAAAVAYLRTRAEIAPDRIGLIGHSEGGLIAPLVAAEDQRLAWLVLLAAPGVRGDALLIAQNRAIGEASGMAAAQLLIAEAINRKTFTAIMTETDEARLKATLGFELALAGVPEPKRDAQITGLISPWFRGFLALDPAPALAKLRLPVLALVGSKDRQVPADQNAPALKAALAGDTQAAVEIVPGLNHLFQTAGTGSPTEYGRLTETIAPQVLSRIGDFVLAQGGR